MWPKTPDICLTVEENHGKPHPDLGSNPGLLGERQTTLDQSCGQLNLCLSNEKIEPINNAPLYLPKMKREKCPFTCFKFELSFICVQTFDSLQQTAKL